MKRERRCLILAGAILLFVALPAPGGRAEADAAGAPRARAWVVAVSRPSAPLLEIAPAAAQAGASSSATATPYAVGNASPLRSTATADIPDSVLTPLTWDDPSGSGHLEGAYSEAHVAGASARSRSGLGAGAGTGYALADNLLTWEQQAQLMGSWNDANAAVFGALNDLATTLGPALGLLNLKPPELQPMAGLGWIDALDTRVASAVAETSSSPSFASARADASAATVDLFGGFIVVSDVRSTALSESTSGADQRDARASFGSMRIAGVEFTGGSGGVHVAGNELLAAFSPQSIVDVLATAGITVRIGGASESGDSRSASALDIEVALADGPLLISIGHAEASAASVGAPGLAAPAPVPPSSEAPSPRASTSTGAPPAMTPRVTPSTVGSAPPPTGTATGPRVASGAVHQTMGVAVARALRTVYLLLGVASVLGALVLPLVVGSASGAGVARPLPLSRRTP